MKNSHHSCLREAYTKRDGSCNRCCLSDCHCNGSQFLNIHPSHRDIQSNEADTMTATSTKAITKCGKRRRVRSSIPLILMSISLFLACCIKDYRRKHNINRSNVASTVEREGDNAVVDTQLSAPQITRRLSKHHHHHKSEEPLDYTVYSCDALPNLRTKYPQRFNQCEFAHNCNDGEGIIFPSLFCDDTNNNVSENGAHFHTLIPNHTLLLAFLAFALLLLFRLLNSTTDEFFSPGLELFSLKLGLPPRFAGVTLLALGNGAPDVAATMNAILGDERRGYEMALGELTGTCMFVTSVILGVIVSLSGIEISESECSRSGNKENVGESEKKDKSSPNTIGGVTCGGPLLRDIAVLILVCAVSMSYLKEGVIDYGFVYTLLGMYGAYVLLVLCADAYHIFYHKPSLVRSEESGVSLNAMDGDSICSCDDDKYDEEIEEQRKSDGANGKRGFAIKSGGVKKFTPVVVDEHTPLVSTTNSKRMRSDSSPGPLRQQYNHHHAHVLHHHNSLPVHSHSLRDTFIEAISNYSCNEDTITTTPSRRHSTADERDIQRARSESPKNILPTAEATGEGPASNTESIFKKTNAPDDGWAPIQDDGAEPLVVFHPHHAVHPHHGQGGLLFLRSKSDGAHSLATGNQRNYSWSHGDSKRQSTEGKLKYSSSCEASVSTDKLSTLSSPVAAALQMASGNDETANQPAATCQQTNNGDDDSTSHNRPGSWKEAWSSNVQELKEHWRDFFIDIYCNEENSVLDVILLSVELPFTIIRKLTNPVPCDGYYCRPLVALSIVLSPIWLQYYFADQFDMDIFSSSSYAGCIISTITLASGLAVIRFAPGGDGPMDLCAVIPLTLYGFAIAATWLDSIADKLVELLELFGILLRIPSTVLGLTVLAFGNSLQDLVANVTLSKKGLSTMATTACFAGPIFNLCVGLGFGFWALMQSTGKEELHVELPRNIATGFWFTIANCVLIVFAGVVVGKGVIDRGYGYVACALYLVYVFTSLYI